MDVPSVPSGFTRRMDGVVDVRSTMYGTSPWMWVGESGMAIREPAVRMYKPPVWMSMSEPPVQRKSNLSTPLAS